MRPLLMGCLLAVAAIASPAMGEASGPDYFKVVNIAPGDALSVRVEPKEGAARLGEIPPGTDGVRNLGCRGGLIYAEWAKATPAEREAAAPRRWCRISWHGVEGWVAARYLAEGSSPASATRDPGSGVRSGSDTTTKPHASAARKVPAAPEDGGPRHWTVTAALNLREKPSAGARVTGRYVPGTVLANLGCQRAEGRVWCDVQKITGGPRGYVAADYLRPTVGPDGAVAKGPDDSALRAGQGKFDVTGQIPCAQHRGQPMTQCAFGVARAGGGDATVVVNRPDGRKRAIFFGNGQPIGADTSQADRGAFSAKREGDLNLVRVGNERYEIPDAVVLGG